MDITKELIDAWLDKIWPESRVEADFDEEVCNGNWLDPDWADEADSEYDWYVDHGRGEAEDAVRTSIEKDLCMHFGIDEEGFQEIVGEYLDDYLKEKYHTLMTF